jgi:hypothetical protein
MIYQVPGKPWLYYREGDTVETIDGTRGKFLGHKKHQPRGPAIALIECEDGVVFETRAHHIRKVERNG